MRNRPHRGASVQKFVQTFKNMHGSLTMFYTYFVSAGAIVKGEFAQIDHYFAPKWQAVVMGLATLAIVIDKVHRSIPQVPPTPPAP
jgi:hypothetical protein